MERENNEKKGKMGSEKTPNGENSPNSSSTAEEHATNEDLEGKVPRTVLVEKLIFFVFRI